MNVSPTENISRRNLNFKSVTATQFVKEVIIPKQTKKFADELKSCAKELRDTRNWDISISGYGERIGSYINDSDLFMTVSHKERFETPSAYQSYIVGGHSFIKKKGNKIYINVMWNGMPQALNNTDATTRLVLEFKAQESVEYYSKLLAYYDGLIVKCQHSKLDDEERANLYKELSLKHRKAYVKALEKAQKVLSEGSAVEKYKETKQDLAAV